MTADTQTKPEPIQGLPGFSRELQLLLCCGGPRIQAAHRERLTQQIEQWKGVFEKADWGLVFQLALWHRMLPLLYWNLTQANGNESSTSVPEPATDAMRAGYVRNISESLRMTADLLSILGRMEEEGVVAIPYKGPILSARLYGNLGLRRSTDLDIIVLPKVTDVAHIHALDLLLNQLEATHGLPIGRIGIEPQIEDAQGLTSIDAIAAGPRVQALVLGRADLMEGVTDHFEQRFA